ncbi:hypothetical protein K3G63_07835 [Hymenobacter sp. HSC-4F20]|uniref:hypothetical protein n=1 Tax=Hymenobacter sp. HSC-4F20 TaxID=2864135 RepID=UPI001C73C4C2|nr:hypothetical protein [Hymenobacter sp. HSC-4F20]MBX0290344.1 hypothetical protein [Hymenobacter sp. HSC-4F20]
MDHTSLKIRQIFLPYLLIVNGVILSFLAIDWQLNQQTASSQSAVWTFFIPGIATLVLLWRFLRPRLLMLEENASRTTGEKD